MNAENTSGVSPAATEAPAIKSNSWHEGFGGKLTVIIITAVVSIGGTYLFQKYDTRIRSLSYTITNSNSIIPTSKVEGSQVLLQIDGKAVENLSTVAIAIYNTTDQDFENVPLDIAMQFPENQDCRMGRVH